MNVLFYLFQRMDPESGSIGGIERHSLILSETLAPRGFRFFFSYSRTDDCPGEKLEDELHISKRTQPSEIKEFLVSHSIDIIHIQQNDGYEVCLFRQACAGLNTKIVLTYHFMPGYELNDLSFRAAWIRAVQAPKLRHKIKWMKRALLAPHYKKKKKRAMLEKFRLLRENCDVVVTLTKSFSDEFVLLSQMGQNEGRAAIAHVNNCVSFDHEFSEEDLRHKDKVILIVARLEETCKRLSIAIGFWKQLVRDPNFGDWRMVIVGDGYSRNYYQKLIRGIPRISLEGRKPSEPYFKRASIYLNTSINEGWCLSLTEAMQYGCVPMSFGSWSSVQDIIDDGYCGFILDEGDGSGYLAKLRKLMEDDEMRMQFAVAAGKKSHSFSKEKFADGYADIYGGLTHVRV